MKTEGPRSRQTATGWEPSNEDSTGSSQPEEIAVEIRLPGPGEQGLVEQQLRAHPEGHVIVVFKSSHQLYLARDGEIVRGERVRKSDLDQRLFGFLKGRPDDEVVIDFPVPVALSPVEGRRRKKYDKKTPEGEFFVCEKNNRAHTKFTVALEISYPNLAMAREAREEGWMSKADYDRLAYHLKKGKCPPYDTDLGGYIKIHGPDDGTMARWRKKPLRECLTDDPGTCRELALDDFLTEDDPYSGMFTSHDWTFGCIAAELTTIFYLYKTVPVGTPVVIYP